jgi:nucleotide-binding universal stress UspA family protein
MYKKIVIPLDGSNLAEQALLYLDEVAEDCPEVLLISVTEKMTGSVPVGEVYQRFVSEHEAEQQPSPPNYQVWQPGLVFTPIEPVPVVDSTAVNVTMGKMAGSAEKYLEHIGAGLASKGFEVTTKVLIGDPAKEIVRFADDQNADLIIMASTGGKRGMSRWNIEHIVEKVVETTKIPVMLVKPAPGFKETRPRRHGRPNTVQGGP